MNNRIHLCIIQPSGYIHSQGFIDQARYARYQFKRFGAEVSISKNRLRENAINIVFGAHLGFSEELKNRYTCVFINLEQLGDQGAKIGKEYLRLLSTSPVIDYEQRNLFNYGAKPGTVPIISFQYAPYLFQADSLPLEDRPIDLLFFGTINERRKKIFSRIEDCGWNIAMFDYPLYGEERDQFIRQSKAVLNCHFYESSLFEQARAFHTLSLGTPLVSERTDKTQPPAEFEKSITWINNNNIEYFFHNEFMTSTWLSEAKNQLKLFSDTDPASQWEIAYQYCQGIWEIINNSDQIWRPDRMNLGSGKDYKLGWLNVDILERAMPDIVVDLGKSVSLPLRGTTKGGAKVEIEANSLDTIYANNVLEHVPDLPCLMTNLLALLKEGGEIEIEVPYEKAATAWQDPTHLRAMNINSWLYYTSWFWYLGWFDHRFEISLFEWLDSKLMPCEEPQAAFMKIKLKKIPTTFQERSVARTMQSDFGGIPEDIYQRRS